MIAADLLPSSKCLSDLVLDQIVAGEIHDPRLETHLARCDRCAGRLTLFRVSHRLAAPTVEQLLTATQSRATEPAFPPRRRAHVALVRMLLGTLAAAGVAAGIVLSIHSDGPTVGAADGLRTKGIGLRFFVQRRGEVTAGASGATYRRGDALRFVISNDRPGFFFLVGIEQTGRISPYVPFGGERSIPSPVGADVALPGSLVLDDSSATEFYVGLFTPEPLRFADIRTAFERAIAAKGVSLEALRAVSLPGRHEWIVINRE